MKVHWGWVRGPSEFPPPLERKEIVARILARGSIEHVLRADLGVRERAIARTRLEAAHITIPRLRHDVPLERIES